MDWGWVAGNGSGSEDAGEHFGFRCVEDRAFGRLLLIDNDDDAVGFGPRDLFRLETKEFEAKRFIELFWRPVAACGHKSAGDEQASGGGVCLRLMYMRSASF